MCRIKIKQKTQFLLNSSINICNLCLKLLMMIRALIVWLFILCLIFLHKIQADIVLIFIFWNIFYPGFRKEIWEFIIKSGGYVWMIHASNNVSYMVGTKTAEEMLWLKKINAIIELLKAGAKNRESVDTMVKIK